MGSFIFNLSTYTQLRDKSKNSETFPLFPLCTCRANVAFKYCFRFAHGPTTVLISQDSRITMAVKEINWIKKIVEVLEEVCQFNHYFLINIAKKKTPRPTIYININFIFYH